MKYLVTYNFSGIKESIIEKTYEDAKKILYEKAEKYLASFNVSKPSWCELLIHNDESYYLEKNVGIIISLNGYEIDYQEGEY